MARDVDGLRVRKWAENAPGALIGTPEDQGLVRADGWPASFGVSMFPALDTHNGIWNEITALLLDIVTHGLLEWSENQAPGYAHPSFVVGSNRLIYRSVQVGGEVLDPVTDNSFAYWRPLLPVEYLQIASAGTIEAGADAEQIMTSARLLAALFKDNVEARWRGDAAKYGLVKRASAAEVSGRTGPGYVQAADLPPSSVAPNSTTTVRGIIRTGTQDEVDAGSASSPAVTPSRILSALRNAANYAATTARRGVVRLATDAEHTQAVPPADKAATPMGVRLGYARKPVELYYSVAGTLITAANFDVAVAGGVAQYRYLEFGALSATGLWFASVKVPTAQIPNTKGLILYFGGATGYTNIISVWAPSADTLRMDWNTGRQERLYYILGHLP